MASYYVSKSGSKNWRVLQEVWSNGDRSQVTVPKEAYKALGINPSWNIDEARKRIKQINSIKSREQKAIVAAAKRVVEAEKVISDFLPEDLVSEFTEELKATSFGTEKHQTKIVSHWNFVQHMIAAVKVEPHEYAAKNKPEKFYHYFLDKKISLDYASKLLRILNMWGEFVCSKRGQYYKKVKLISGRARQKLVDTNAKVPGRRKKSAPLTPELLEAAKNKMIIEHYNWHRWSVWFGLRPEEVDQLHDESQYRVEKDEETGVDVLWVYQSKLMSIEEELRWKGIPAFLPEQKKTLDLLGEKKFKRPHSSIIGTATGNRRITNYGGRTNFKQLMKKFGQKLENVSMWLGHQTVDTTWEDYTDKQEISFDPPPKKKAA